MTPTPEAEGIELDFPHQDDNYWIMIEVGGVKVPQYPSPLEVKMLIEEQLQKARHDWLRGEIVRLEEIQSSIDDFAYDSDERGKREILQTIIDRYQSELDQDKALQDNK